MQPCLPEVVRRLRAHRWGSLPDSRAWHTKGCCDANVAAEARCGQRLTRGRTEVQSRARTGRQTCFPTRPVPPPRRPSNSAGVGRGTEGETPVAQHPHLHAQHLWVPAPTCPPARHRPDISTSRHSPPASPGAGSSAGHTPLLHCYARRSLVHHLSPPSVWERQGKGRRELGLEGGVSKSAPAWLWMRAGSACVRTEGWMMDWMSWSKERMQISGVRRSEDSENERSEVGKDGRGLSPVSQRLARYDSARLQVWGWQSCLPTLSLPP